MVPIIARLFIFSNIYWKISPLLYIMKQEGNMYTIKDPTEIKIIIKNSTFIGFLTHIESYEEVPKYLSEVQMRFPGATHYVYAYIIGSEKRFCDDKEPAGTAGSPILNVLEKEQLNYVLAIVVRYFGGIKLGAGGLVRAYTNVIHDTIEQAIKYQLEEGMYVKIEVSYSLYDSFCYHFSKNKFKSQEYKENIIIEMTCSVNDLKYLSDNGFNYTVIKPCLVTKELE